MRTAITKDGSIFFWRCAPPHTRAVPQLPDRAARHDHNSAVQKGVNHFQDSYLLRKTYFGAELPALVGNHHTFAAGQPSAVDSNLFGFGYKKELIFLNGIWLAK